MYYIIVGVITLLMIFVIVEVNYYNKFQVLEIRIKEAFNNIDILLEKKFNLLERTINIIKENEKKYKNEDILPSLIKIKNQKLDRFQLNHELAIDIKEYYSLLDLDKNLSKIDNLKNINDELRNIENDLNAAEKYYNDTIVLYNNLIKCFPSNIIGKLFHYHVEDFFQEEKIETLEILKEK